MGNHPTSETNSTSAPILESIGLNLQWKPSFFLFVFAKKKVYSPERKCFLMAHTVVYSASSMRERRVEQFAQFRRDRNVHQLREFVLFKAMHDIPCTLYAALVSSRGSKWVAIFNCVQMAPYRFRK